MLVLLRRRLLVDLIELGRLLETLFNLLMLNGLLRDLGSWLLFLLVESWVEYVALFLQWQLLMNWEMRLWPELDLRLLRVGIEMSRYEILLWRLRESLLRSQVVERFVRNRFTRLRRSQVLEIGRVLEIGGSRVGNGVRELGNGRSWVPRTIRELV